jgi:hypothetical protein
MDLKIRFAADQTAACFSVGRPVLMATNTVAASSTVASPAATATATATEVASATMKAT